MNRWNGLKYLNLPGDVETVHVFGPDMKPVLDNLPWSLDLAKQTFIFVSYVQNLHLSSESHHFPHSGQELVKGFVTGTLAKTTLFVTSYPL